MHISNIRRIKRAQWRFWAGYTISVLLIFFASYFSFRSPTYNNNSSEKMLKREQLWKNMSELSVSLSNMYDLEKKTATSENRDQIDKLDKAALSLLEKVRVQIDDKDLSFAVHGALRDFRFYLGQIRNDKNLNNEQIEEKYRKKYELENLDLRTQLRNAEAAKNQAQNLGRY